MDIKAFCSYPFNRVRVTAEGNVAMCCFQRQDPLSDESPYIGNLLNDTFDDIWYSEVAEEIRRSTLDGVLHKKCNSPGCPFYPLKSPYPVQDVVYNEYPTFLEIDLPNTHCNVGLEDPWNPKHPACVMCERASPLFKPEENHLEKVIGKIKHLMPNLLQVHIQGIAEPFYKDLFFNLLDWLNYDDYKNRCTMSMTTNGTLFNRKTREMYLERCPHSITNFSIDAATPETYTAIRKLPVFDKVLENLYAFDLERIRNRQFLRVCNNINNMNVHEVLGMVHIAARANVEYVEFNPTDGFNHLILVNESNCGQFKKAQKLIEEECERLAVPLNFIRPLDMGLTDRLVQITL